MRQRLLYPPAHVKAGARVQVLAAHAVSYTHSIFSMLSIVALVVILLVLPLRTRRAEHDGAIYAAVGVLHIDVRDVRLELVKVQSGAFCALGR